MIKIIAYTAIASFCFAPIYISLPIFAALTILGQRGVLIFLMLLSCVASNIKGMYTPINYILFTGAFFAYIIREKQTKISDRKLVGLLVFLSSIQVYGFTIGQLNINYNDELLRLKDYISLIFSILFPYAGILISQTIKIKDESVKASLIAILIFLCMVVGIQLVVNPLALIPSGLENSYSEKGQLVGIGEGDALRSFGPTTGPNALALVTLFLYIISKNVRGTRLFRGFTASTSLIITILTYSKSSLITFLLFVISKYATRITLKNALKIIALISVFGGLLVLNSSNLLERFRIGDEIEDFGTRAIVYSHMLFDFDKFKYIYGIGPYTWREYFDTELGLDIQDPHSWIFSIPGGYGVIGIIFYVKLTLYLFSIYKNYKEVIARQLIIGVLLIYFVKDIASIPAPLGTTHFTFLFWLLIGIVSIQSKLVSEKNN